MFDLNVGWAVISTPFEYPETSRILRTTSGLQAWQDVTPPLAADGSTIRAVEFMDANSAVVVSTRSHLPERAAVDVYTRQTRDGGISWEIGETMSFEFQDFYPEELTLIDLQHGWMLAASDAAMGVRRAEIFETQNGGLRWEKRYDSADHLSDPTTLWLGGFYPFASRLVFRDAQNGFFSDGEGVVSRDQGTSWDSFSLSGPDGFAEGEYLSSISVPQFTSDDNGFLLRRFYRKSETSLAVFTRYPNATQRMPLPDAQYFYFTRDGGLTWTPSLSPVKLGTVFFLDGQTGWLLGKSDADPAAPTLLYHTKDGAETWAVLDPDSPLPLGSAVQFVDQQTGFAYLPYAFSGIYRDFDARVQVAGQNEMQIPALFTTLDGGKTWAKIEMQSKP